MTANKKMKDNQVLYNISRKSTKISALPPGTIDKFDYLTGEIILPTIQGQIALTLTIN